MKKLSVLGPKGTYSDIAAKKYLEDNKLDYEIEYHNSILKTALAIKNSEFAILPFENTLDGFVMESMDAIIANDFNIIYQLKLDIDFAFVTNSDNINDVKDVYCQFKAYGQCIDFISKYDFNIIQTQSNSETVNKINKSDNKVGAIIPIHALENNSYKTVIMHVADRSHNETRFLVVSKNDVKHEIKGDVCSSIVITIKEDKPGVLFNILKNLSELEINMNSIMSRPMKTEMGQYKFYIECTLNSDSIHKLNHLTTRLSKDGYFVKVLGIYNKL